MFFIFTFSVAVHITPDFRDWFTILFDIYFQKGNWNHRATLWIEKSLRACSSEIVSRSQVHAGLVLDQMIKCGDMFSNMHPSFFIPGIYIARMEERIDANTCLGIDDKRSFLTFTSCKGNGLMESSRYAKSLRGSSSELRK